MAEARSGIFTYQEFRNRRNVLKLAPDVFITINNGIAARVVAPMENLGVKSTEVRGGITSLNASCSIVPAGASRATLEISAPQYKGLHEDYYITLPNGVRVPIFTPMMEIKIFMKGRFLETDYGNAPRYYPVFWGMITSLQENYSNGSYNFSITCEDMLSWWRHQKITLQSDVVGSFFGGAIMNRFPSTFQNMSAWEIIMALFSDTFFATVDKDSGLMRHYNFVYPQFSNIMQPPDDIETLKETWGPISNNVIDYWNRRFGFGVATSGTPAEIAASLVKSIPLEMYGLRGMLKSEVVASRLLGFLNPTDGKIASQSDIQAKLDLDFGMLARVQPYGLFDLYGDGAQPQIASKLEIANNICEKVNMEFFVDTNGNFVFKPPFYNLDVASGNIIYYRIEPQDIINFNSGFDSNAIVNYLVVTGPIVQQAGMEAVGVHADFNSIAKYGIRSDQVSIPYGMNSNQLKMIAVAEMTRRNGAAYTGSVSIPLRPEMRLGYPVYLPHVDSFYYVTGLTHSFTFGSAATTDLSLQYRRERVFDDGNSGVLGSKQYDVLAGCVMRNRVPKSAADEILSKARKMDTSQFITFMKDTFGIDVSGLDDNAKTEAFLNELQKERVKREKDFLDGPGILGYWKLDKAKLEKKSDDIVNSETPDAIMSNELVMITGETVPYTDRLGYRHVGAFPFGANLVLTGNGRIYDSTNYAQVLDERARMQITFSSDNTSASSNVPNKPDTTGASSGTETQPKEKIIDDNKKRTDDLYKEAEADILNPQNNPDFYNSALKKSGIAEASSTDVSARTQIFYEPTGTGTSNQVSNSALPFMWRPTP